MHRQPPVGEPPDPPEEALDDRPYLTGTLLFLDTACLRADFPYGIVKDSDGSEHFFSYNKHVAPGIRYSLKIGIALEFRVLDNETETWAYSFRKQYARLVRSGAAVRLPTSSHVAGGAAQTTPRSGPVEPGDAAANKGEVTQVAPSDEPVAAATALERSQLAASSQVVPRRSTRWASGILKHQDPPADEGVTTSSEKATCILTQVESLPTAASAELSMASASASEASGGALPGVAAIGLTETLPAKTAGPTVAAASASAASDGALPGVAAIGLTEALPAETLPMLSLAASSRAQSSSSSSSSSSLTSRSSSSSDAGDDLASSVAAAAPRRGPDEDVPLASLVTGGRVCSALMLAASKRRRVGPSLASIPAASKSPPLLRVVGCLLKQDVSESVWELALREFFATPLRALLESERAHVAAALHESHRALTAAGIPPKRRPALSGGSIIFT